MTSEISRRSFLKGAGSAAAAATVTGLLAGCSTDPSNPSNPNEPDLGGSEPSDNPGTSGGTDTKKIYVQFAESGPLGRQVGNTYILEVPKDATTIDIADVDPSWVPERYKVVATGSLTIESFLGAAEFVQVPVERILVAKDITVHFVDYDTQLPLAATATVKVEDQDTSVDIGSVRAPEGYDAIGSVATINNNEVLVQVTRQSQSVCVIYRWLDWRDILWETIKVPGDAEFVTRDQIREKLVKDRDNKYWFVCSDTRTKFPIQDGRIIIAVTGA